jgi:transposase
MSYTTDLTDEQFELLDSIIPKSKTKWNIIPRRKIFNAIFYQLKNGYQWRDLPKEFPKWETVYSQFRRWKQREVWKSALLILAELERVKLGKNEIPSLLLGDSQVVKNTNTASIETKGFCFYKNVNGIKRHLLVDVLGNPYFTKATKANLSYDEGLIEIIQDNQNFFLNLPDNHVITILLDNGYHKQKLEKEIKKINPDLLK